MNNLLQKINNFAKRFYQEISEDDVSSEYDINNTGNSTSAEYLDDKSLEELKNAQKDVMSLFSRSVDPNYTVKEKNKVKENKDINNKANNNFAKNTKNNNELQKTKDQENNIEKEPEI